MAENMQKEKERDVIYGYKYHVQNVEQLKFFKAFVLRVRDVEREDLVHYKYVPPSGKKQRPQMVRVNKGVTDEIYDTCDMSTMLFSPSAMLNLDDQTYVPVFNAKFPEPQSHTHGMFPHKNGLIGCIINVHPYNDFIETFIRNNGESCRYPTCGACSAITNGRKKCGRCRQMYCNRICQEAHWPEHKALCRLCVSCNF